MAKNKGATVFRKAAAKTATVLCFAGGTLVHADSGLVEIQNIKEGDWVLAYNEPIGEKELKQVTATFVNTKDTLYVLRIGKTTIEATGEHPFFVEGSWVIARDLEVGNTFNLVDGTKVKLDDITINDTTAKVYNFEVEGLHNYYVADIGVLVHNDCGVEILKTAQKQLKKLAPSTRTNAQKSIDILKKGKAGGNQHRLTGDRKGLWAIDIANSGKGRGALRIVYEKVNDTKIIIREIIDYH